MEKRAYVALLPRHAVAIFMLAPLLVRDESSSRLESPQTCARWRPYRQTNARALIEPGRPHNAGFFVRDAVVL